jgi:regulator of replication initiation timing
VQLELEVLKQKVSGIEAKNVQLEAENALLRDRLATLESAGSSSAAAALNHTSAVALSEAMQLQLDELRQQLQQQQAAAAASKERVDSVLSALGAVNADTARGQARMWDSTQELDAMRGRCEQLTARVAELQQKYEAQQVTSGQLHSAVTALQQQLAKQDSKGAVAIAHAPADMHPDQLLNILAQCGNLSSSSFVSIRLMFQPRDNGDGSASRGSDRAAEGAGGAAAGAGAGSSAAAAQAGRPAGQPAGSSRPALGVFEVTLASGTLLPTYLGGRMKKKRGYTVCSSGYAATDTSLGGRMRGNLRRAGHRIYVEEKHTPEQRAQHKIMQALRRQLIKDHSAKLRWRGLVLQQW